MSVGGGGGRLYVKTSEPETSNVRYCPIYIFVLYHIEDKYEFVGISV